MQRDKRRHLGVRAPLEIFAAHWPTPQRGIRSDTVNGTTKYVASTTLKAPEVAELGTPVGRRRGRMYNPLYLDVLRSIRAA